MQDTLYQYLILYKQLSLPGIGTIQLQKISSEYNYGEKVFAAPVYTFKMEGGEDKPSKRMYSWLSGTLNITEWDAIRRVNDFSFDLKNRISSSGEAKWLNVGVLHRDEKGNIILDADLTPLESEMPVQAEKVIREKAEHTVRVGEMEKTSFEMEELLGETVVKKDYSWIIAIVVTGLSVLFLGWYFSEKGINPSSTGNQSVIQTK